MRSCLGRRVGCWLGSLAVLLALTPAVGADEKAELRAALAHELAHVRRRDYFRSPLRHSQPAQSIGRWRAIEQLHHSFHPAQL